MSSVAEAKRACREIADELRELGEWLGSGRLDPQRFSLALLELESNRVTRHGLTLTARISQGGRTEFALHIADTRELCARLEMDDRTGEILVHHLCD